MKIHLALSLTAACAMPWLFGASVQAHHAFAASFDAERPITVTGTVTSVEWRNPHTWFYVDVTDDEGAVNNWGMEMASPNLLMRNGWTRSSLKVGDIVTVEGFQAKNGSNVGNAQVVTLASTGKKLFTIANRRRQE